MYLSNNEKINFHIGLEIIECWTKDLRRQNYSTGTIENNNRFDVFIGIKAGWILPLRKRTTSSFYYLFQSYIYLLILSVHYYSR